MSGTEIEIPMGTLRPTLRAAKEINATFTSFMDALRRVESLDLNAFVAIIAAGLGKKRSEVEDQVWGVGLPDLVEPLSNYVTLLANGGRPIKSDEEVDSKPGE